MAGFAEIIGHEQVISYLRKAAAADLCSHACILQGAKGSGKKKLAEAFAQMLQCENPVRDEITHEEDACGACRSCHMVSTRNHPDVIWVTHDKPGLISIDEVRSRLIGDIQIKPYSGRYKVYIMPDAQLMNPAAQNALLKTLEEPPSYAVILLLTENADMLLDTVRSRCVLLDLKPLQDEQVEKYLMEHMQIPDYQARLSASFAQGSIGKAIMLSESEEFAEMRRIALQIASRTRDMDVAQISLLVKDLARYKGTVKEFLDILTIWYRDVLLFKATQDADLLVFRDQLQEIRSGARLSSYEGIETILQAIRTAGTRLDANVSFDLVMELLLLTIKEN